MQIGGGHAEVEGDSRPNRFLRYAVTPQNGAQKQRRICPLRLERLLELRLRDDTRGEQRLTEWNRAAMLQVRRQPT